MQRLVRYTEPRVYLKSRKFSLFLQAQLDFALNSLEIHKGFLRLFALNPACACEIFVIFFVFRYTLAYLYNTVKYNAVFPPLQAFGVGYTGVPAAFIPYKKVHRSVRRCPGESKS